MAALRVFLVLYSTMLGCYGLQMDNGYILTNTTSGTVRGIVDSQTSGSRFLGIPFAKEPTGVLRFRPPQEPEAWLGIKDMFQFGKRCMQESLPGRNTNKSIVGEDCLFLNIYSPQPSNKPLPVMLWIHGGGYTIGTGSIYDGSTLAQKGVIVVTINYRLDIFGFLSMEDDSLPGNYGMLDQIAALKWVRDNIANFGGDPNQVTIFGESAGSSSVSLLIMSPLAKGLFQRAILESGVAFSPWGYQHPGNRVSAKMFARMVALGVNCNELDDSSKLVPCLQNADAGLLIKESAAVFRSFDSNLIISPRVESTYGFLPELPHVILEKGTFNHVDTIHGFCSDESQYFFSSSTEIQTSPNEAEKTVKRMHYWLRQLTERDQQDVYTILSNKYAGNDPSSQQRESLDSQDDIGFVGPIISELKLHSLKAPEKNHFLYEFDYRPSYSKYPSWVSAAHADDLRFVFGFDLFAKSYPNKTATADDNEILQKVTEMWTNFAKNGNPVSTLPAKNGNPVSTLPAGVTTWSPYTENEPKYLLIKSASEEKMWLNFTAESVYFEYSKRLDGFPASKYFN